MRKIYTFAVIFIVLLITCARNVYAQNVADSSASLKRDSVSKEYDYRSANLKLFLQKYNSPLAEFADEFIKNADQNGLDYRLVPSISGVESTFGKFIPYNSFNAYGWANGDYRFTSWEDSIKHVSETLKNGYIEKGAATIAKIARRYAPPSTTWGKNVVFFVKKIDTLPLDFDII